MRAISRIDKLGSDAYAASRIAHRPFEHVVHAELAVDLLHVHPLPFVRKTRIAGHDKEPVDPRERSDNLAHHTLNEIFLLCIAAQIGEGQYRDRGLVGQRDRRS